MGPVFSYYFIWFSGAKGAFRCFPCSDEDRGRGGGGALQVEHARWWWEDGVVSSNALISLKPPLRSGKNWLWLPEKA